MSDPRIDELRDTGSLGQPNYREESVHTNSKAEIIDHEAKPSNSTPSLTHLIDRLEHLYSFASGLQGHLSDLNTKLGGPVPREDTGMSDADKPNNCLAIAHALATDIERRLTLINDEIKRLHDNIGE